VRKVRPHSGAAAPDPLELQTCSLAQGLIKLAPAFWLVVMRQAGQSMPTARILYTHPQKKPRQCGARGRTGSIGRRALQTAFRREDNETRTSRFLPESVLSAPRSGVTPSSSRSSTSWHSSHTRTAPTLMRKFSPRPGSQDEQAARYAKAHAAGDFDTTAVIAGEAVDLISDVFPAAEVVERMVSEATQLLSAASNRFRA
jgi:hypothetical protein